MNRYLLLFPPVLAALMALRVGGVGWKLAVPGTCGLAVLALNWLPTALSVRERAMMLFALLASLAGDYFLASRSGHSHYFEFGIGSFLIAHLCLVRYALWNGRLHLRTLGLLLALFLPYYAWALFPRLKDPVLGTAVLLYLMVSCLGFAAAYGFSVSSPARRLYVLGIGMLLFSDTLISFSEFLRYRALNPGILPTYYLFLLAVTASALARRVC